VPGEHYGWTQRPRAQYVYVLGAAFKVPELEQKHGEHVFNKFSGFLKLEKAKSYLNLLLQFCSQKVFPLLKDALTTADGTAEVVHLTV